MHKIDLSAEIPDECNAIEILIRTEPRRQVVEVHRSVDDPKPLTMWDGGSTIIGRPAEKCLYIDSCNPAALCEVQVRRWLP